MNSGILNRMAGNIDPWSDVRAAIRQRDIRALMKLMFDASGPELNMGFNTENELWDYKKDCPKLGKDNLGPWADLAKEVLGLHNNGGGALVFGISDNYTFVGARNRLDSKQLNDGLRRFLPDRIWVDFNREFIRSDQSFLGFALVPPRGPTLERFTADAPPVNGKVSFRIGWSALRTKDSTYLLTPDEADRLDKSHPEPIVGRQYAIDEPYYRILQPDYRTFVPRNGPCAAIENGLYDERVAVVSIVGIGGIGKTALATWAVLRAYQKKTFQFIVSITAKDRELTASGIRAMRPGLTSFEALLDSTADVLGFPELKSLESTPKESEIRALLTGCKGLLCIDNLETVDDARVIQFLDNLPDQTKAIITSRRTTVRKLISPVDLGGLNDGEVGAYIESLADEQRFSYARQLNATERLRIGDACDRIPLAIRWILSRAHSAAEAITNAEGLTTVPRKGEILLEFSFRRVFDGMSAAEKGVLQVLSLFQKPLPTEALIVGSGLPQISLDEALESLSQDVLIQRQFDPNSNDYVFTLKPIPRSFLLAELDKQRTTADNIRRKLTDWYEGRDVADHDMRLVVRELRQGRITPELGLLDLAKAAERNQEFDNAAKLYEQALSRVPTSWRAAQEFAEFKRHKTRDRTGALHLYERAAANAPRRGPDRALIFREYGFLLRESGEANATDLAIEKFDVALQETPNDPITIYGLASMLDRKGYSDRIIELIEPLRAHSNPKTRERCLPLLLKAYERKSELLKAAELRDLLERP
jgi:tetratricopeptide (TPR) repeat protein